MSKVILETHLPLPLVKRGKARDIYELPESKLLLVATDRISAFDQAMKEGIPEKGRVLTQISRFWFEFVSSQMRIPTHFVSDDLSNLGLSPEIILENDLSGRIMIVKKATPIPLEWIVSGYLCGSLWKEYQAGNWMSQVWLRLELNSRLPKPVIRLTTKVSDGHDEPLTYEEARDLFAKWINEKSINAVVNPYFFFGDLVVKSLDIYGKAEEYAQSKGFIVADTKMEWGFDADGGIMLIDELFTPDSSRFWLKAKYKPGENQENQDKQILRDWLESQGWPSRLKFSDKDLGGDKESEPPSLPTGLIERISAAYQNVLRVLCADIGRIK